MLGLLPEELIETILLHVDITSLTRCRQVCTRLNALITYSTPIGYKIELSISGLENGPSGNGSSTTDRLRLLLAHREAWNHGHFTSSHTAHVDGLFWGLYGGVLGQYYEGGRLSFVQLGSKLRGLEERSWTLQGLAVKKLQYMTFDPTEELLVLIDERRGDHFVVRLCCIETGVDHPMAKVPTFQLGEDMDIWEILEISVDLEYLAILVRGTLNNGKLTFRLFIYNWVTGALEMDLRSPHAFGHSFLTSKYMLFVVQRHDPVTQFSLVVFDLISHITPPHHPIVFLHDLDVECQFAYPRLKTDIVVYRVRVRYDASPSWRPQTALHVPFFKTRDDRLLAVVIDYGSGWQDSRSFLLMVPSSTILERLEGGCGEDDYASSNGHSGSQRRKKRRAFAWDEWGVHGTQFVASPYFVDDTWGGFVYGTTMIHIHRPSFMSGSSDSNVVNVVIYEAGQVGVRRLLHAKRESSSSPSFSDLGDEDAAVPDDAKGPVVEEVADKFDWSTWFDPDDSPGQWRRFFEGYVVTKLPMCKRTLTLPLDHARENLVDVIISEDHVVLVYDYESDSGWRFQFLTF